MLEAAEPSDPIVAVVHPDPYPYYARLRRERPLYLDSGLGLWVAATRARLPRGLRARCGLQQGFVRQWGIHVRVDER